MLNHQARISLLFQALADPTRRLFVERLSMGPASVSELRQPTGLSLPAVMQHLQVLEACGLVRSEKTGRVRMCRVEPEALTLAEQWITARRANWQHHFDRLEEFLAEPHPQNEKGNQE
jgi:DNA-binding transcriptional ArsR family regulator